MWESDYPHRGTYPHTEKPSETPSQVGRKRPTILLETPPTSAWTSTPRPIAQTRANLAELQEPLNIPDNASPAFTEDNAVDLPPAGASHDEREIEAVIRV